MIGKQNKHIVITGAESTGKSTLAAELASHFRGHLVSELAREYVENLDRPYVYADVEKIAQLQRSTEEQLKNHQQPVFFDTWFIITKIWFQVVYNKVPIWIDEYMNKSKPDLFLVCENDLDWVYDPVRENPNKRNYLKSLYINEIEKLGVPWSIVTGKGSFRLSNAVTAVNNNSCFTKQKE